MYTPNSLRKCADVADWCGEYKPSEIAADIRAHADAWEADIRYMEEYARLWHKTAARIEALEKAARDTLDAFDNNPPYVPEGIELLRAALATGGENA